MGETGTSASLMQLLRKTMITSTYQNPIEIHSSMETWGKRYTFWYLTEQCDCSVARALYLILLSL